MSWTCNTCGKTFSKEHQSHKCEKVELSTLFENRAPQVEGL